MRSNGNNTRGAGQYLYPGAYGSKAGVNNRYAHGGNSNNRFRYPNRYSYNPYGYGPYYAPFISYYGGYDGAYSYAGDGSVTDADVASNNPAATVTPQYSDQGPQAGSIQPTPPPQNNNSAAQGTVPNNGPDSLVEAVQQELIRRGYFAGKVDAMFDPETQRCPCASSRRITISPKRD